MSALRQPGWYWVRRPGTDWEPAEWAIRTVGHCHYVHWDMLWSDTGTDEDIEEVGPRIPAPDEHFVIAPESPSLTMIQAGCEAHWRKQQDMSSPAPTEGEEGGPMEAAWHAMLRALRRD